MMSSNRQYGHLLARTRPFLALTNMGLLHSTRSSSRNHTLLYRPPLRRTAEAICPLQCSMTTVCPAFRRNLSPQYLLFGPKGQSRLQVIHQPPIARNSHTRVKSVERDSQDAAICFGTCGYTPASGHSCALSQVAGRSSFRYVMQKVCIVRMWT
jgi:hypothetical protein